MATITTPPVRVSFPQIFVPKAIADGEPRYSIALMFDKNNPEHKECLKQLRAEAQTALEEKWPDPAKRPRIPIVGDTLSCIKDGDTTKNKQGVPLCEKSQAYAGHFIISAASKQKPAVVDRRMQEVLDKSIVYGGCYCKVNINAYAFDVKSNAGVTFGLNGVQVWKDGDPFGNRPRTIDMFSADEGQDDPSNYEGPTNSGDDVDPFA
jgi:hypothetical protein